MTYFAIEASYLCWLTSESGYMVYTWDLKYSSHVHTFGPMYVLCRYLDPVGFGLTGWSHGAIAPDSPEPDSPEGASTQYHAKRSQKPLQV